jgi:hypothetical protein
MIERTLHLTVCIRCGSSLGIGQRGPCPRCIARELLRDHSAPAPLSLGEPLLRLGDYELIEELARGGRGWSSAHAKRAWTGKSR